MIVTNAPDKISFSDIDPTMPSTWDLSAHLPNGALTKEHVQVRVRPVPGYWSAWGGVDTWDNATKVAGFFRAGTYSFVEFRRRTPRYDVYLDPLASTSRVSNRNLKANADQGLFVAVEWAGQYGIDAYQVSITDPGDGPNQLKLIQQTQNHWGPDADYTKTTWDFQFAGGYIDRAHVKAQALLPAGWTQLDIDPSENDPDDPSDAPFRFIGDFQLRLDLSTLEGPVTGLVIYRHTPRDVNVAAPADNARITAASMEPSARHAVFVAVEIGEELSKNVPTCDCNVCFTSIMYPIEVDDTIRSSMAAITYGQHWGIADDALSTGVPTITGTLTPTITYVVYDNAGLPDTLAQGVPVIDASSTLTVVIAYVTYDNVGLPDTLAQGVPTIDPSSTLTVVIAYITYDNAGLPDTLAQGVPSITSGSLT